MNINTLIKGFIVGSFIGLGIQHHRIKKLNKELKKLAEDRQKATDDLYNELDMVNDLFEELSNIIFKEENA